MASTSRSATPASPKPPRRMMAPSFKSGQSAISAAMSLTRLSIMKSLVVSLWLRLCSASGTGPFRGPKVRTDYDKLGASSTPYSGANSHSRGERRLAREFYRYCSTRFKQFHAHCRRSWLSMCHCWSRRTGPRKCQVVVRNRRVHPRDNGVRRRPSRF